MTFSPDTASFYTVLVGLVLLTIYYSKLAVNSVILSFTSADFIGQLSFFFFLLFSWGGRVKEERACDRVLTLMLPQCPELQGLFDHCLLLHLVLSLPTDSLTSSRASLRMKQTVTYKGD